MEPLPPLRFVPIFQPYVWGGRRLADWFPEAPAAGPIAEAWLVSDEAKFPSRVADGPFAGRTLRELAPLLVGVPALAGLREDRLKPGLQQDMRFQILLK